MNGMINGDNTQNQLQVITPQSLSTMKINPRILNTLIDLLPLLIPSIFFFNSSNFSSVSLDITFNF